MIITGKLTMVNVFVLSLSTKASHPHFVASWGCVFTFLSAFSSVVDCVKY